MNESPAVWAATVIGFVSLIATGFAVYVRLSIAAALAAFESRFFQKLNGKYVSSALCGERQSDLKRRVDAIEEDQRDLHEYAHESVHELKNSVQGIIIGRRVTE